MADVSVRPARPSDAGDIARIQVGTWRTAYADLLPAAALENLTEDRASQAWGSAVLAPPSARHHVLVALEQEWTVGFAALGPAADPGADGSGTEQPDAERTAELGPLLVEPRWGRRGHGSRLLAAAVDHALADGMVRAVIWIPEADTASRTFLISAGWAPDGLVRALDTGGGELREIRLHTDLVDQ